MESNDKPVPIGRGRYPEVVYPAAPVFATQKEEKETSHLRDYWNVIASHRMWILAILVAAVGLGLIWAYKQTPIYRATASIQMNAEPKLVSFQDVLQVQTAEVFQTQLQALSSRTLARQVIADLHLDKAQTPQPSSPSSDLINAISESTKRFITGTLTTVLSSSKTSKGETNSDQGDQDDPLRPHIDSYLGSLIVTPVPRSRLVRVSFESADPRLAVRVANTHAEQYIEQNLKSKWEATRLASTFLSKELLNMKANLEKAEDALAAYRDTHNLQFVSGDKNADIEKLAQLQAEVTKAQTEKIQKDSMARFIKEQGGGLAGSSDAKLAALQLEDTKLAATYREDYFARKEIRNQIEEIKKQSDKERADTIKRAEADSAAATGREAAFEKAFQKQQESVDRMGQEVVQYNILKREADSNRQLYDTLLQRLKEAEVSSSLTASSITIMDRAELPRFAVRPNKKQIVLNSFLGGLVLAVGFAFFLDYMDRSIKSPDDIAKHMKLPTLAVIPRLTAKLSREGYGYKSAYAGLPSTAGIDGATTKPAKVGKLELITHDAPSSLLAEAYRSLRASVLLSSPDHPPQVILVSSALPSEGKTSTAANLAISLAQTGARVLIVDADMRRPRMDSIFGLRQKPGLSAFLSGAAELTAVIYDIPVQGLYVLPCGLIPPNPSELILSARFKQMLSELRKTFNHIIIDSPPLNNVSDSRILATVADAVVLVVKARTPSRHFTMKGLEHLEESRTRIAGVVLNDYDVRTKSSYYYHYYSGPYAYRAPKEDQRDSVSG